jgi:hypothetical protein
MDLGSLSPARERVRGEGASPELGCSQALRGIFPDEHHRDAKVASIVAMYFFAVWA